MRLAAVFGTRDRVIVNVIRNALGIPVKWYFSYEEILQDNMRFDWVIASTSAPCRTDVTEAIKRLQDISERLILFAKEPLFDSEKIHWILGKQFTVREIKEQLQALVSQAPQQHIEDNDCACETSINTGGPAREEGLQQGILCAIGQEDIESRLEAKINFIGKAKNVAELMDYTGTLRPETIILSIRLPGMDNPREIVTDILSKCRRLVFLAGDIDPEEKWMETLKSRGAHVIFDPVNITELLEAITGRDVESSDIKAKRNNGLFVRLKDRAEQIIERVKPAGTLDQNENTGQADYNKAVANASWYSSTCDFHRTSNELADESLDASRGSAPKKTVVLSSLEKLNKLKEGAGKIARKTRRESSRNTSKQAGRNQIKVDPTPTKDLPGKINCCNGQQTGLIQARPATDQSREGVNVSQPVPASERLAGVVKAKTVAVTSLISDEGGTPLILSLIQHLMGREPVAVIDGDVEYRGLGTALSVSDNPLVSHSWDRHAVPVVSGNIKLYPLHRSSLIPPSPDALTNVINLARQGTDLVLIDCGSLKDTWYYRSILEEADVIVWHYIDDRIAPEEARFRWKERLKILTSLKSRQREIMVFQGQVDAQLIEDIFRVPVVKLKSMDDQAGLNLLLERIRKAPFQGRTRVLVAGYDMEMVPRSTPDELYDFVYDPEEACEWLRNHHYDAAIVNFRLRGASLLEYDLRERGIVVQKQ